MHRWMWFLAASLALPLGCRPREEGGAPASSTPNTAAPRPTCPPLDAVFVPLSEARGLILKQLPADSPERWRSLSAADEAAARVLSSAAMPEALDRTQLQRLGVVLEQMAATSAEVVVTYEARADANATQETLREHIDAASSTLQTRCPDASAPDCAWAAAIPPDPDGADPASLRSFVAAGRALSIPDADLRRTWTDLLDSLTVRADAIDEEARREASVRDAFGRLQALDEEESTLLLGLATACPVNLPPVSPTAEIPLGLPTQTEGSAAAEPPPPSRDDGATLPPSTTGGDLPPATDGGGGLPPVRDGGGGLPPATDGSAAPSPP